MNHHKEFFFKTFAQLIPLSNIMSLAKLSGKKVFIPFYHTVSDFNPAHVKYLYPVITQKQFIADIDSILKKFEPIGLKELIRIIREEKKLTKPVIHITFDDGFTEFNDIAAPILLSKGVPASCFLNSSFIDNQDFFYRCKASLLIDKLHNQPAGSPVWKKFHDFCKNQNLPSVYYRKLLLSIGYDQREILDSLAKSIDLDFNKFLIENKPYLSTGQIQELLGKGFTFGAHSIDHPNYRFIPEEERYRQTKESIEFISSKFKLDYKVFSFPFTDFGMNNTFFKTIYDNQIADLTFGSAGLKTDSAKYNLHRFSGESNEPGIENIVKKELKYYFFLKLIGKHKIRRD